VRGDDFVGSARMLVGQIISNRAMAVQQYLSFLGELGRIVTGRCELAPSATDKRFTDPAWKSVAYRALAQCYLALADALNRFVDEAKMDKRDAERVRFVVSLILDAMSPTNSLVGNPAALKKLVDTGGASVVHGLENFIGDLARNGGLPAQVDTRKFVVGKNLATTPGSVVYRSPVMELIQYRSVGNEVHRRPLLIAPPQINKFYVFDLVPEKSIVQFALKGDLQTFAMLEEPHDRRKPFRARYLCRRAGGSRGRNARYHRQCERQHLGLVLWRHHNVRLAWKSCGAWSS
jgi:polyhydroxyalkanoate synthase